MDEPRNTDEDTHAAHEQPHAAGDAARGLDGDRARRAGPNPADPAAAGVGNEVGEQVPAGSAGTAAAPGPSVEELQDRWQRAVAELENLRKRYERQLDQARRGERDRVSAAWLPVLDHLELALRHAQADPGSIVAGVQAVHQQALSVLAGLGYRRVEDVGVRFDPTVHEAAQMVEHPQAEPNTVVAVLRPGYVGDQALLRPAVVTVAGRRE